jgi:RimJ/RimL family protein N-acetyltransferase
MERPLAPPEPPLSDGVIVLRPWHRDDAAVLALVFGSGDAKLAYWMDEVPQPYTMADAAAYVDRSRAGWHGGVPATPFAICDVVSADVLGWLGLTWDEAREGTVAAGYWTRLEARGRGVAPRALLLAAAWLFGDIGVERFELRIDTRNEPSRRVAKKAGFTLDGIRRSARVNARDGRRFDEAIYSLLRHELPRKKRD